MSSCLDGGGTADDPYLPDGDLSQNNASSLTVKAFIEIQDDNLPKLVACQALVSADEVTLGQFCHFMQQAEE
ncbi:MAG: hypothetical protein GPOALKHO_000805 [Sodalis sp.]|nr:MAG: hypothetical protein GPOALKHO_000805 [Sodalis sp.]